MVLPIPDPATVGRRRPRNRKQQILAAAARQFWEVGYHQVGMADLAAAVGIGASAMYRHFRGKQDLLVAVMHEALDRLDEATTGPVDLDRTIAGTAALALERREFGALWDREAGHLPDQDRDALRDRLRMILSHATEVIAAATGAPHDEARTRAHALYAVLESPSHHRVDLDGLRFEDLLERAARAVVDVALPVTGPARHAAPGRAPQLPASRREALLAAAIRLFGERGFPSVSMNDLGTATGIAGPSVYNHFENKNDLLVAALTRGNEALWLSLHHALAAADGPADALDRALDSYVTFATANPAIISVLLAEVINLPTRQRDAYRRVQQDYVAEWVALLSRSRPEIGETEARVLVHAALTVANSLARARHLQQRPALTAEIAALGRAVLRAPLATRSGG
ncbi:TetR/AcrR family transcriptional regulator [Pseudonocardia sp. MH-G8]|uniref:TetR/AcrR family transcriptional regulator n=1 Tax=Pseudonocardia sp. MH-G8 TaxID=1854588 RepID=UPI0013044D24|nr:TetR/AcrR family transcriptional regulator [Pseudonocardia sp. MH-G8]